LLLKKKGGGKNFLIEFMDVTIEEPNKIVNFFKDPDYYTLADKSKNLHCMVISLLYRKDKKDNYNQNMRVGFKLLLFKIIYLIY
jgi:hypothetical protein